MLCNSSPTTRFVRLSDARELTTELVFVDLILTDGKEMEIPVVHILTPHGERMELNQEGYVLFLSVFVLQQLVDIVMRTIYDY